MRHDTLPETTDSSLDEEIDPSLGTRDGSDSSLRDQQLAETGAAKPKLLDQVRQAIRALHYSKRTEKTYVEWTKRFIYFNGKRHPLEMGEPEINQFLTDLAVSKKVSGSTQNQSLRAILFLYVWRLHKRDLREGAGRVVLPYALARKYPNADREWGWQWAFPAPRRYFDKEAGIERRHHLHETAVAEGNETGCSSRGNRQASHASRPASFICDSFAGGWLRHSDHTGVIRGTAISTRR